MALDHAACRPDTAVDVVQGPKVDSARMCGIMGQATIASTAIVPRPGEEYMKIVCQRSVDPSSSHRADLETEE